MNARRVDHTAIAVANLDEAIRRWQEISGALVEHRALVEGQRVEVAMLRVGDTRIELIRPTDGESGVARFLAKHGESLHHIGFQVNDLLSAITSMEANGFEFVDALPRPGAHGLIAFLRPRSTGGVLVELIQRLKVKG